jgi:hypothetical protein
MYDQCGGKGGNCKNFTCANAAYPNYTCESGSSCKAQNEVSAGSSWHLDC